MYHQKFRTELSVSEIDSSFAKIQANNKFGPGDLVAKTGFDSAGNFLVADTGVVIGNVTYETFVPRINLSKEKPGVYLTKGNPIVQWSNTAIERAIPDYLVHLNPKAAAAKRDENYAKLYDTSTFIRDLPELEFFEFDRVQIRGDRRVHEIYKIYYHNLNRLRQDGTPFPCYSVMCRNNGEHFFVPTEDLTFVERGNLWNWYHGKPINFESEEQKTVFLRLTVQ